MAETLVRLTHHRIDPRDEIGDVFGLLHRGLNDSEFVTAEARDKIRLADTAAQPDRHGLQQFIADRMAQRIVDTLEFVDVDIEHRELTTLSNAPELLFEPLAEQGAVGKIGQRIVVRKMNDLLLGSSALCDVFMGCHPTAICRLVMGDLDRTSVSDARDRNFFRRHVVQDT